MIYIVRHGETDWNKEGKLQGHTDTELNDTGRKQALILKDKLQNIHFDKVFVSPLKRTRQTAEIITKSPQIIDSRIIERNNGLL